MSKPFWIGASLVALLTLAAHAPGLRGQFLEWDDTTHITQNPAIRALNADNLRTMFTQPIAKLYVPLTWLSFAIDYKLWGRHPFGYHLTNLALHTANTVLVALLLRRLLLNRLRQPVPVALLTAALFGLHPLRVESVAWATERKDVLFAFFYLLGLLIFLRRSRPALAACFALFVLSALSKPTAITFPLTLILLDWYHHRRVALREKIPFFLLSLAIGVVTIRAQAAGPGETVAGPDAIPVWARPGLVGYCALFYVKKFLIPTGLCAIYPTYDEMNWSRLTAAGYAVALLALAAAIASLRRRAPIVWPAWLFYLVTLSPSIGLLPAGIHIVADRFSYLPSVGLALPAAAALVLWQQKAPRPVTLLLAALLSALALATAARSRVWHDTESLFTSVLRQNPNSLPAHINLSYWYTAHQRFEEAIAHGRRAVELAPRGWPGRKNLAFALAKAGRHAEAIGVLRAAVEQGVDDPKLWSLLAECFEAVGEEQKAAAARQRLQPGTTTSSR